MRNFTWNRFPIKNLLIDSLLTPIVESTYLQIDCVTLRWSWWSSHFFTELLTFRFDSAILQMHLQFYTRHFGFSCASLVKLQRADQQLWRPASWQRKNSRAFRIQVKTSLAVAQDDITWPSVEVTVEIARKEVLQKARRTRQIMWLCFCCAECWNQGRML